MNTIAPEPNRRSSAGSVCFLLPPPGRISPTPVNPSSRDAAPVVPPILPADGEQRPHPISSQSGVNQFLDVYDDVVAVADHLKAMIEWYGDRLPASCHPSLRKWVLAQEEELRAIAWDIADICNDLIPGAPAAPDYHFVAYLEPFGPPPLPGGPDQTNKVSQRLAPVPPEWMGSRQK